MNVLSLFDGMSCGQLALNRAGIKYDNYYASEIDKYAIKITQYNFPYTIQIVDVTKIDVSTLPKIDLILAGSPCQGFSFAGNGLNFEDPRSKLFFEFVRILREVKERNPDVKFLLENVEMKREHELTISRYCGIAPLRINSALVSAQNRVRLYWTNIAEKTWGLFGDKFIDIPQPKDKRIFLKDVLEDEVDEKYYLSKKALRRIERSLYSKPQINPEKTGAISTKNNSGQLSIDSGTTLICVTNQDGILSERNKSTCIDANYHKGMDNHSARTMVVHSLHPRSGNGQGGKGHLMKEDGKSYAHDTMNSQAVEIIQTARGYNNGGLFTEKSPLVTSNSWEQNNTLRLRRLTPIEVERLQTVPDNYTACVSDSQRYKMLGNGWNVDTICHILQYL